MDDIRPRLVRCFAAVFPKLNNEQIVGASTDSIAAWDSVASVTLFAMIEEEFELEIDVEDLGELVSFDKILTYLNSKTNRTETGRGAGSSAQ